MDKKIADGAERLLLLDAEDLADAAKALANWRAERRRVAAAEVERAGQGKDTSPEAEVGRVMAELGRLRHEFDSADPAKVRAALRSTIESITLFFGPGPAEMDRGRRPARHVPPSEGRRTECWVRADLGPLLRVSARLLQSQG